jgi:hypothetical protein
VATQELGGGHRPSAGGLEFEDFERSVAGGDEEVALGVEDGAGKHPHPALSRRERVRSRPHRRTAELWFPHDELEWRLRRIYDKGSAAGIQVLVRD